MSAVMKLLWLPLLAVFVVGSSNLLAAPPVDKDDRDALTADFGPIDDLSKGRGDGQYMELQNRGKGKGINVVLNANARVALAKVDDDGNVLVLLNNHLWIDSDGVDHRHEYGDAVVTLFIGTDEDGDGTCLTEGPHSICQLLGGDGDPEINDDDILHVAYKLALRTNGKKLKGDGVCWTNFDEVVVVPEADGVIFHVYGGEVGMPDIEEGDGSIVGFDAPWIFNTECGAEASCKVVPILATGEEGWHD